MSITVSDLDVKYPSGRHAVRGVSFSVNPGEVVALIGGNGAGKSTTMRVLAGATPSTGGRVEVAGHDISTERGADAARARTGYCPDMGGLSPQLTVRENIAVTLACSDQLAYWPAAHALAERLDLARVFDEPVGSFSHGMGRRVSALLALLGAKDVLLLDEPFDGVDAEGVQVLCKAVRAASDAGLAVVISTHLLQVSTKVADRALVMKDGQVVAAEPAHDLAGEHGNTRYLSLVSRHTSSTISDSSWPWDAEEAA